uniref:NADH-ubiquinone oxidoreductase chain 6 n=1 Tax=Conosia irrorata TaxID=2680328 RepID=A0A7T8G440_9DIPT|nr:NADH dehydrogenase subunit 6 [Conosia irrorata]QQP21499.1 NADH dehydrogenase subunit 6 [Conosia irrorata]
MFMNILIFISIITSIIFTQMKHPLAMGMMLLFQTLIITMISGLISKSFWYSYILFLIFLGGMLVLFIYVTSLASNEMFSFSNKITFIILIILNLFIILFLFMDMTISQPFTNNIDMINNNNLTIYLNENNMNLMKLYNFPTNLLTLILINYLFLTLIIIVKITNNYKGPLRPMN